MGPLPAKYSRRKGLKPGNHVELEGLNMNRLQPYFNEPDNQGEKAGINRMDLAPSHRVIIRGMIWSRQNKEKERFYLLPGMGGKAQRRKNKVFLAWSILTAVVVSFALAVTFFLMNLR